MADQAPHDPADLLTSRGFTFTDQPETTLAATGEPGDDLADDPEFQPRPPRRFSRLTLVLIGLIIWGVGFLVGVIADRAAAGLLT
ncbi:hypothetical protein [Propionicimonas sp.]|uniref:hypothetical protein n=1 Tax=Propionicimonas sp. TaxID=1955623 RepID=UPI0039E4AAD3